MDRVEELIRESLQARARDVEPTPLLWLEVDRRVARRKRFQVLTWSLAGATAVLAAVLAVPMIVAQIGGTSPDLEILPADRLPAAGVIPAFYVADVDGELQIREVRTGEHRRHHGAYGGTGRAAREIEVRPGSTATDYTIVATHGGDDQQPGSLEIIGSIGGTVTDGFTEGAPSSSFSLPEYETRPEFVPSVAWAPDQDAVALTLPMPEADGTNVVLWTSPAPADEADTVGPAPDLRELGLVVGVGEVELLDWVGRTTTTGDESVLVFRDDLGVHVEALLLQDDGSFASVDGRVLDDVHDLAGSHVLRGSLESPDYAIVDGADGPVLRWSADGDRSASVPLVDAFGDGVDPAGLWLDAKQDAAIVGDGTRTVLFAHDGNGAFVAPVELPTAGRAALFDAPRPGAGDEATDETPNDEPAQESAPDDDASPAPAPVTGGVLPEPVVQVSQRMLTLRDGTTDTVLFQLPEEGESTFESARVRPGSTPDDLTIVALHRAEGMQDLRTYRYVDGETTVEYWDGDAAHHQVGFGGLAGDGAAAYGPVWSPDGDKLAWIEYGSGAVPNLRVIGWDDGPGTGDTATDNAAFTLDTFAGSPINPLEWVDLGDGRTEIRAVVDDFDTRWAAIPIDIQSDGAASMTGTGEWRATTGDGSVHALAGVIGNGAPQWMLKGAVVVYDPEGEMRTVATLPDGFFAGEGIPTVWMRVVGDGVLVGTPNTGRAWYIDLAGDPAAVRDLTVDADVVR